MTLDFFAKTSGTWINVLAVALGTSLGLITGVGGLMILGTGINLLELTQVRVASFLPALALAPLLYQIAKFIG